MSDSGRTLEERLARFEAVDEIKRVKSAYARFCDDNYNPDGIASLFVEDGVWSVDPIGTFEGRDAIHEFFSGVGTSMVRWALHLNIDPVIDLAEDGQSAVGSWYVFVPASMARESDPSIYDAVIMSGRYEDTFVKVDGRWRLQRISGKLEQISDLDKGWVEQQYR